MLTLFETAQHKNVFVDNLSSGHMVQANQHVIVSNGIGMVLDPGGHKVYTKLFSMLSSEMEISALKHIFFSHQDPDIIASTNGWLMVTNADAYLSELWMRFIPHFGVDELVVERIKPIPDEGMIITVGDVPLKVIPAHFLHSPGNFQLYDPVAKILYTGDLGASLDMPYSFVEDFAAHVPYMEGFHKRYMANSKALKTWVNTVRQLDIEIIAPQHGAMFPNKELSQRFIDWIDGLSCGTDFLPDKYAIPA
ncbi:Metallo-beta-lactamase superfamily protein [Desulfuromusa kysingii]|uniref:Metallo-beta-lactamase superfamily protein n=1 Tax=Desulfuromusa kysingii TaxID=37625 RepID=A0A1H4C9U1_9BACT|nr:MBL fold metallo-hydrolase [Desulfuromusa kysingii]SEA57118.1 Metallo-beta-lactamase superfamily protein [Desulfuromusa kysingii]